MGRLLDNIETPADLKVLSTVQLEVLAREIRDFLVETVSKTGGHLASSLGVVELTIALHHVFDFSHDKLLWDVGHQCYVHKILTGRRCDFDSLRREGGLSGFPDPVESPYDQFTVGHAGTSVATAIGMALAQQLNSSADRIVAFVGDASIVNGTSFEALNNLGLVKRQMLVVLNDNSMAIDATQGAVAKFFSQARLSQKYEDMRKTAASILEQLPVIGRPVEETIERIKKSIRMTVRTSQLFESLNIPYFGPVDGHDIGSLIGLFRAMEHLERPAVLHAYTGKGRGFSPAERDRPRFHSTGPFTINGAGIEPASAPRRSFTDAFGEKLLELAEEDDRIVAITSAMCDGTGLGEFRRRFPGRFYDVGIAETAAVDIAAGLAKDGLRPVVCIYSTFLQRSFDHIFQEVALQNLPVVFCIDRAGLVGPDGPTHHGLMDIGFLRMMPNTVLAAPADDLEMSTALEFAIGHAGCVCLRYPKDAVPVKTADSSGEPFELGKCVFAGRQADSHAVIISYGPVLDQALLAAEILKDEGIRADVINARFAEPIDEDILTAIDRKAVVTVEDHYAACGFGSAVLELAYAKGVVPAAAKVIGVPKPPVKHGTRKGQLTASGINAEKIAETTKRLMEMCISD